MINGVVNADGEAVIPLVILDAHGRRHEFRAVIDTGFNGYSTLPSALIDALDLTSQGRTSVTLVGGSSHALSVYMARLRWDDRTRTLDASAVDVEPLIGMALLRGYALRIDVMDDGAVHIEALP